MRPKRVSILIFVISFCLYGCHKDNPVAPVTPPPTGISGTIYALATYNNNLVVGGNFCNAGGVSAQYSSVEWLNLVSFLRAMVSLFTNK